MTMEADLTTLLKALCPRVFTDFAPAGTARPYIVYQAIGGRALRWLNGEAADKRHTIMQIEVWTENRGATLALVRQVETALRTSPAFNAQPAAEPTSMAEEDLTPPWYGSRQDFDIYSLR